MVASDVTLCVLQHGQEVPGAASQEPNSVTAHCKATHNFHCVCYDFVWANSQIYKCKNICVIYVLSVCPSSVGRYRIENLWKNFHQISYWSVGMVTNVCRNVHVLVTLRNSSGHFTWFSVRIWLKICRSEKYFEETVRGVEHSVCVRYIICPDAA
jgi:hypothetical protein